MGREFLGIFKEWATDYDNFVKGQDQEYLKVFENYSEILKQIVTKSGNIVLEFGSGTGNLTLELLQAQKQVYPCRTF